MDTDVDTEIFYGSLFWYFWYYTGIDSYLIGCQLEKLKGHTVT